MSKLCSRNEKVKKETGKYDFYDFGIAPAILCKKCDETNSNMCLMAKS